MKYVLDVDASKVIEAVRSTGVTITPAMMHYAHYLISNMKNIGTWDLCNAVYGFVGGTADSHKWNWKDLRDVDSAFRLTYSGGITHSALGMQGNGSNGYANTYYSNSALMRAMGYYVNTLGILSNAELDMGILSATDDGFFLSNRYGQNFVYGNIGKPNLLVSGTFGKGYFGISYENSNIFINHNNSIIGEAAIVFINTSQNYPITIGARNSSVLFPNNFSNKRFAFSYIASTNLTKNQAQQQSQIVTNAQNILNRA